MKKLAALVLSAALLAGSAAAVTPEEATPASSTWRRAPGTPTPPGCAVRWG